jgi:hypothetical protein
MRTAVFFLQDLTGPFSAKCSLIFQFHRLFSSSFLKTFEQLKQLAICCVYCYINFVLKLQTRAFRKFGSIHKTNSEQQRTISVQSFINQYKYLHPHTFTEIIILSTTVSLSDHRSDQHTQGPRRVTNGQVS